jgi:hypothetical protein
MKVLPVGILLPEIGFKNFPNGLTIFFNPKNHYKTWLSWNRCFYV